MASSYNMKSALCLSNLGCGLLLLTILTVKGDKGIQAFSKPVGGNVTFHCIVDMNRNLKFIYFQKGGTFINGYHSLKPLGGMWSNTKRDNTTFYMYDLRLNHSGTYTCVIQYDKDDPVKIEYNLTVTVPYSKPSFTVECHDKKNVASCQVTCTSQDGFPREMMTVSAQSEDDNSGMVTSRNDSVFNLTTKLFSSTVTVEFSCSKKEVALVCSVAGVTSEIIPICTPPSVPHIIIIIPGILLVVLVVAVSLIILRRRRSGAQSDSGPATNAQESVNLNQSAV